MVDFLNDSFTGPNGTFITDHDPNWEEMAWDLSGNATANRPLIQNNRFFPADINGSSRVVRWNVDPGDDQYDVSATWSFRTPAQSNRLNAIFVRMTPTVTAYADVNHYRILGHGAFSELYIDKIVGGVSTSLQIVPFEFATGEAFAVRVEVRSTGIEVYIDDALIGSTSDTEITQRGRVGISSNRSDGSLDQWQDNLVGSTFVLQPTADATTPTPTVAGGTANVQLNGAASGGAGAPYTYLWEQLSGTAVTLSNTAAQNPTFDAPSTPGDLVFGLTVTDSALVSSPQDQVTVSVLGAENTAFPVADIDVTGWTSEPPDATTLASTIADTSNATYIISPDNPVDDDASFSLSELNQPSSGDTVRMNYRAAYVNGTSGSVTVYLMQEGTTQIATRTHEITAPAGTFEPFEDFLTPAEIEDITAPLSLSGIIEVTSS